MLPECDYGGVSYIYRLYLRVTAQRRLRVRDLEYGGYDGSFERASTIHEWKRGREEVEAGGHEEVKQRRSLVVMCSELREQRTLRKSLVKLQ